MNVVAASAFVDVSERVMDIIKRRVSNIKKGAGSKPTKQTKGQKDGKKAVSLSHLQSTIADTMSNEAFQQEIWKIVAEQVSRVRVEHFRRFRDYLRAVKRSGFNSVGSGGMLDTEAQQKVMVRIRRAVLEELSSRQYATLARTLKVRNFFTLDYNSAISSAEAELPGIHITSCVVHAALASHSAKRVVKGVYDRVSRCHD